MHPFAPVENAPPLVVAVCGAEEPVGRSPEAGARRWLRVAALKPGQRKADTAAGGELGPREIAKRDATLGFMRAGESDADSMPSLTPPVLPG